MELFFGALAFALSGFVQGVAGFGSGMVLMALLPLWWEVSASVPLSALFSVILNTGLTWHLRGHCQREEIVPLVAGGVVGIPLGVAFLAQVDPGLVTRALGAILLAFGLWQLAGLRAAARRPAAQGGPLLSRRWAPLAGLLSGLTAGAYNVGAPAMLLYASGRRWERDTFRANLQGAFWAAGVILLGSLVAAGLVTEETLRRAAWLIPAGAVGGVLGAWAGPRLGQETFQKAVLVGVVLMGMKYLV